MKMSVQRHLRRQAAPTRKRSIFQIHLLTAVVLMILAGAMVGANVPHDAIAPKSGLTYLRQGWPFCFYADFHREDPARLEEMLGEWFDKHPDEPAAAPINDVASQRVEHGLRLDIVLGIALLVVTVVISEILISVFSNKNTNRTKESNS